MDRLPWCLYPFREQSLAGALKQSNRGRGSEIQPIAFPRADVGGHIEALECVTPRHVDLTFDLIVLFYHFDRDTAPAVLSALKPGGLLICKSSVIWKAYEGATPPNLRPLEGEDILSSLSGLRMLHHSERRVRDRGVVEYVDKSPPAANCAVFPGFRPASERRIRFPISATC